MGVGLGGESMRVEHMVGGVGMGALVAWLVGCKDGCLAWFAYNGLASILGQKNVLLIHIECNPQD